MYPNLFPEKRTFSVSETIIEQKFEMNVIDPFKGVSVEIDNLEESLKQLSKNNNDPLDEFLKVLIFF